MAVQTRRATAFYTSLVDVGNFTSDFTFQLSDPSADGFTFTIQNSPSAAKLWARQAV